MNKNRRKFLQATLVGSAAAVAGCDSEVTIQASLGDDDPVEPKRLLVLGGTGFIGPHMVREMLRRGHEVTLFNRGRTNSELFPDLELIVGDRNNGLDGLKGHSWDAVVDNSGYVPRHVRDSAQLIADVVSHYVYVSTISVYADFANPIDEGSPLATMEDESVEEVTGETYGPMKALCERAAAEEVGEDRLTILRPTYICGPGDRTDRYTYWPVRTMRGGEMLWPGTPDDPIQIIDVRDLANFTVDCIDKQIKGTFNTVTPAGTFSMGDLLDDCVAVTAADMTPVWVSKEFIAEQALADTPALPIWAPPGGEYDGIVKVDGARARGAGLHNRPTRETARDTIAWWKTLPEDRTAELRAGLKPEQEAQLLAAWAERNS